MDLRRIYTGNSHYTYVNMSKIFEVCRYSKPEQGDKYVKYCLSRETILDTEHDVIALFPVEWEEAQVIKYLVGSEV